MAHPINQRYQGSGPGDAAEEYSEQLVERLREAIRDSGGSVDFSEFMHRALYEPGLGYYVTGHHKLGAGGDFVTAPQMGGLFARCLARQCDQVLESLGGGDVLEFGAGSGELCAGLLEALDLGGRLPERYLILELSPDLRERQHRTITERCPRLAPRCAWLEHLPENFEGVVIANEVLDAMPVERFRVTGDGLEIVQVTWSDGAFRPTTRKAKPGELSEIAGADLPVGYESEAGVLAQQWVAAIGDWLQRGLVLIVDYGFPEHEYYHPERAGGTLMCHFRHRAHADPYRHVGMQDITAHLDFTALARRADEAGLDVLGFTNQGAFLLSLGLLDIVRSEMGQAEWDYWRLSQEVQRLTQSHEMGELFKVLALGRECPGELAGFQYIDHRARL